MKRFLAVLAVLAVVASGLVSSASALTLYDGTAAGTVSTSRSAGSGLTGQFAVSQAVELAQFGMQMDLTTSGNIKFIVFDGSNLIYQSGAVASTDVGFAEFFSPVMSLILNPGRSYFIGAITDMGATFRCCGSGGTQGFVTSVAANSNPLDFDNPTIGGIAGAHIQMSLYGDAQTTAVPLPASLPLLGAAMLGFGLLRRRRG